MQRSPAVILATRPLGEADLLVVMLTPGFGKIRAAAKSARRSKRRFAGGLPGGSLGEATIVAGRRAGALWRLDAFAHLRDISVIGRDLQRFAYVAYVCEVTDALVHEPEPDARLFAALSTAIEHTLEHGGQPAWLRWFELRLLDSLGLLPALRGCCVCGEAVLTGSGEIAFHSTRGGSLCRQHADGAPPVEAAVLEAAASLAEADDPARAAARLTAHSAPVRRAVRDLTAVLLRAHLRRPLRSLEFFAQLGKPQE